MAMARKKSKRREARRVDRDEAVVVVCRGGDCGSRLKHPRTDHPGQLRQIRAAVEPNATVLVSKCLDACEHSNVIVVIPDAATRTTGEGPTWIGGVNDEDTTNDITQWVNAGQPHGLERPTLVDIREFTPTRLSRHELDNGAVP